MDRASWLFEAPLLPPGPTGDPLDLALAEWAEEEYHRHNKRFRQTMAKTINDPKHPLNFLVTKAGKFTKLKSLLVDAGHLIPVRTLARNAWGTERLLLQDRRMNRSDGAKMGATGPARRVIGVMIGNVPVELRTLAKWVKAGFLDKKYLRPSYVKANRTSGWPASPEAAYHFLLGETAIVSPAF